MVAKGVMEEEEEIVIHGQLLNLIIKLAITVTKEVVKGGMELVVNLEDQAKMDKKGNWENTTFLLEVRIIQVDMI